MNPIEKWLEISFEEVKPYDFYRTIFPLGELDKADKFTKGKYTAIIVAVSNSKTVDGKRKVYRYTLTDELNELDTVLESNAFCICSPISYAGRSRTAENARYAYAITIDVDKIKVKYGNDDPVGLRSLWKQIENGHLPRPTFIVFSGSGIHLYYVFENPIPLFRTYAEELQEYKRELTKKIWNDQIVDIKDPKEVQQEGIYQGFRMPGTVIKPEYGKGKRARAFLTGEKVTFEYMNQFVDDEYKAKKTREIKKGKTRLEEAKDKWPDWYEKRIVKKEPLGVWHTGRAVYDWWKQRILNDATVGHRYYCIMMLAIYAKKCGMYDEKHNPNPVTEEELENDAFGMINYYESLTVDDKNHFGADDVQDALEAYNDKWIRYPRKDIEDRTAIKITPNRRNGRNQKLHLMNARSILENQSKAEGRNLQGRKSKQGTVLEWINKNPGRSKAACIRETGLSKSTVYSHWPKTGTKARTQEQENRLIELTEELKKLRKVKESLIQTMKYIGVESDESIERVNKIIEQTKEEIKSLK